MHILAIAWLLSLSPSAAGFAQRPNFAAWDTGRVGLCVSQRFRMGIVQPTEETARIFVGALCGKFSNAKQAEADANFQLVETCYRPMLGGADVQQGQGDAPPGISLLPGWPMFQESQTAGAERPYKSSVVHVVLQDGLLKLQSYRLSQQAQAQLVGSASRGDQGMLPPLCSSTLTTNARCDMKIEIARVDGTYRFVGTLVSPGGCTFQKGGCEASLDARLSLTATARLELDAPRRASPRIEVVTFTTEDRFYDVASGKQVWGSEHGPYAYEKRVAWPRGLVSAADTAV